MTRSPLRFGHALLRRPGRSAVNGLRAGGPAPEHARLLTEHSAYAAALERAGVMVEVLEADEPHPDSMFVEDPALVFPEAAILLRPGAPTRMGEADLLGAALADRFDRLEALEDGHADGGDVLVLPDIVLIGLSARTDRTGAEALGRVLTRLGYRSRVVAPPSGTLHLKTAATLIADDMVLMTAAGAESGLFEGFKPVLVHPDEPGAANALRVNDTLIVSAQYSRTAERLERAGLALDAIDTSHVARLDGGLTCMSLRY